LSFAMDIYRQAGAAGGNVVLSPYSIAIALRMLLAGARGKTAEEIARVVPDAPLPVAGVLSANALWMLAGYPLEASFVGALMRDFGAIVEAVDFARSEAAAARINRWVSDQTRGNITNLVPSRVLDGRTRLVLTNAVYLKALWTAPFDPEATRDAEFHLDDRREVTVKMMAQRNMWLSAARIPGGRVFEIPYQDGALSMLVCLPDAVDGLAEMEAALDPSGWTLTPRRADVFLPRFGARMSVNLKLLLQAMGIRCAFDEVAADLSGIANEELYVSAALHEARIEVDEKGTEAAAATAISIGTRAALPRCEEFRVDRPFLFFIRAADGAVVFIGRVADPRSGS
jgi:serpin B